MFLPDEGVGFPTSCRDLARNKPNMNDPNGYYVFLDLPPWASVQEIRRKCKQLLAAWHPDGSEPNPELFAKAKMIYQVLGNPAYKAVYDHTPPDHVYVDEEVVADQREGKLPSTPPPDTPEIFFTYLSDSPSTEDRALSKQWYEHLLRAAWETGCVFRMKLHLTTSKVNQVVGEEVYVYKLDPSYERARAIMDRYVGVTPRM